jgi:histidinol dehydrogenase
MSTLNVRRIHCADPGAARQLAELRGLLGSQADVVSPRSRQLTEAVFGEALSPVRVVERVCADVRARGLPALLHYTEQFDRARLDATTLRVAARELAAAHAAADPAFL